MEKQWATQRLYKDGVLVKAQAKAGPDSPWVDVPADQIPEPLSWEQVNDMWLEAINRQTKLPTHVVFARAIEAAHGITAVRRSI